MLNRKMSRFFVLIAILAGVGTTLFMPTATAAQQSFVYTDSNAPIVGALSAVFTVDVTGGQATSGTGTITFNSVTDNLTLVTSTNLPSLSTLFGNQYVGQYGVSGPGAVFTWQNVPTTAGGNVQVDTVVNAAAPYMDDWGLAFLITDASNNVVGGFNPWAANPNSAGTKYITNFGYNHVLATGGETGMLSLAPVPEMDSYVMMLAGLGLLGAVTRRRKQKAG